MEKVGEISLWKRITKSDLQTNSPIYMVISVYLGVILFIINIVMVNLCSLSDIATKWRNNCAEKISIEIPSSAATEDNMLKIKNMILDMDGDVNISVISKEQMMETLKSYMGNRAQYDLPLPMVIEVQNFNNTLHNVEILRSALSEISDSIKLHDHSKILNPAIKVSSFVESSYCIITFLIIFSLVLYILIYCYQNILINKQNIYILTMLCADKKYIFKQIRVHLGVYFMVSFFISLLLSCVFGWCLFDSYPGIMPDISICSTLMFISPALVFAVLLMVSKYATYFVIKNQSFDCF